MDANELVKLVSGNPGIAMGIAAALVAIAKFFKPISAALQSALVRRINQAWVDEHAEPEHEARVRKTADRVKMQTLMPLPRNYVEGQVRKIMSQPPPPKK